MYKKGELVEWNDGAHGYAIDSQEGIGIVLGKVDIGMYEKGLEIYWQESRRTTKVLARFVRPINPYA